MIKGLIFSITLLLIVAFKGLSYGNNENISQCHQKIKPLHLKRERVAQLDGMWGLFDGRTHAWWLATTMPNMLERGKRGVAGTTQQQLQL